MKASLHRVAIVCVIIAGTGCVACAHAQESLVGTYRGAYILNLSPRMDASMELTVSSVEGGIVRGTATVYNGQCAGVYSMRGRYENSQLRIRAIAGPCNPFGFRATHEENRLEGLVGGRPLKLWK